MEHSLQYRSLANFVTGNTKDALEDINAAIRVSPNDVGSLYYRGMIELGLGQVNARMPISVWPPRPVQHVSRIA